LILATSVRHGDDEVRLSGELVDAARKRLPNVEAGPLATVDGIVDSAEKARLSLEALAVDMESYHLAAELSRRELPFLVVRCVLDPLWEDISNRPRFAFARRALSCARRLGGAARTLAPTLAEVRRWAT
jgi:nucleoside phosphorylase